MGIKLSNKVVEIKQYSKLQAVGILVKDDGFKEIELSPCVHVDLIGKPYTEKSKKLLEKYAKLEKVGRFYKDHITSMVESNFYEVNKSNKIRGLELMGKNVEIRQGNELQAIGRLIDDDRYKEIELRPCVSSELLINPYTEESKRLFDRYVEKNKPGRFYWNSSLTSMIESCYYNLPEKIIGAEDFD